VTLSPGHGPDLDAAGLAIDYFARGCASSTKAAPTDHSPRRRTTPIRRPGHGTVLLSYVHLRAAHHRRYGWTAKRAHQAPAAA